MDRTWLILYSEYPCVYSCGFGDDRLNLGDDRTDAFQSHGDDENAD